MIELRLELYLAKESFSTKRDGSLREQHLQGDGSIVTHICGAINNRHTPSANLLTNFVAIGKRDAQCREGVAFRRRLRTAQ